MELQCMGDRSFNPCDDGCDKKCGGVSVPYPCHKWFMWASLRALISGDDRWGETLRCPEDSLSIFLVTRHRVTRAIENTCGGQQKCAHGG